MMIADFHSHILPGIDDGSKSLEESIAMLRLEAEQGIRQVIATPHFYPRHDRPDHFLAKRREAECRLREEMARHEGLPHVNIGAEVHFFSGISETDILDQLTIDQKSCILLEMPVCHWTESMYREIENIWTRQGITPIIAHIDRYISPLRSGTVLRNLMDLPVFIQANAGFFLKRSTGPMAMRMLRRGEIHLLGSDCHNLSQRPPNLGTALDKIRKSLGEDILQEIILHQRQILADES